MSCLLPTALSKASARCVPEKLTQVDKFRSMEFHLMNRTDTAVRCYSVHHVSAGKNGKLHNTETSTKGIRIKAVSADYHSN